MVVPSCSAVAVVAGVRGEVDLHGGRELMGASGARDTGLAAEVVGDAGGGDDRHAVELQVRGAAAVGVVELRPVHDHQGRDGDAEDAGDGGGLVAEAVQACGDVLVPVEEAARADAYGVAGAPAFGVREEHGAGRGDQEVVHVGAAGGEGPVVEDAPAFPSEGGQAGGGAALPYGSGGGAAGEGAGAGVDSHGVREADQWGAERAGAGIGGGSGAVAGAAVAPPPDGRGGGQDQERG
jgi:hypothetical protein